MQNLAVQCTSRCNMWIFFMFLILVNVMNKTAKQIAIFSALKLFKTFSKYFALMSTDCH